MYATFLMLAILANSVMLGVLASEFYAYRRRTDAQFRLAEKAITDLQDAVSKLYADRDPTATADRVVDEFTRRGAPRPPPSGD